jgi:MFS family permease
MDPESIDPRSWRDRTFASLDNPNYARFFGGQVISLSGSWMQSVALAWLVLQITGSAAWLGAVIALQTLPVLFLALYGGLVADRTDKRRLLIWTQALSALQALILAWLTHTGTVAIGWVLALSVMLGVINAFDQPARQAFVREMVDPHQVRNAVSLNAVIVNVSRAIGPAIAGILIATVGVAGCFLVNGLSFLAVIVAYATMRTADLHPVPPTPRAKGQLRDGLSYVRRTPSLLLPLVMMALVGTFTYEFQVSLPALTTQTFGGDAQSLGFVTAAMGVGAVIGGLASAGRAAARPRTLTIAVACFGLSVLLVAIAPTVPLAGLCLVAVGASSVWFMSTGNTALQLNAEGQMRGRVMALWSVAFIGTTPIGGPIIGAIAQVANPRWALAVGAAAAGLAALIGVVAIRRGRVA